jgi:hypothetical protein
MAAMSTPAERPRGGTSATDGAEPTGWYEREVPGIVAGLEASGRLGTQTRDAAWELLARGRARAALELVLGAVDAA